MLKFSRKFLLFLGVFLCLASTITFAQVITVKENATITANISATQPTRIAVENDRITVLRGQEGAYTDSNDNNSGSVFLKPTKAYQNKSFYVFISTEQNHHYVLQLTPSTKLSAGMLILKSHDQQISADEQWEIHSPYTALLARLMRDMINRKAPENFEVIPINAKNTLLKGTKLNFHLETIYSGAPLQGEIYEVTNPSKTPITITESLFYQPGDRAIALQENIIPAGSQTFLYKVTSHG